MFQRIELKHHPEVKRVVLAAFPSYKKHNASIGEFYPCNINSYWDGGSRSEFAIVELATMARKPLPTTTHPYFGIVRHGLAGKEDSVLSADYAGNVTLKVLPEGFALVEAGTFCGKPATARVYVNSANLTKLLPAVQS
jgi:hypothetical protein